MAESICESFRPAAKRLLDLGLGYLSLDRAASTLSTGERQRMQLARAVRNRTTGVLYVLDEPSIGLHPSNIAGLTGVMQDLVDDGNSVVLVDHDAQILSKADWIIEMGPGAGNAGGQVIAQGSPKSLAENGSSQIGPFLMEGKKMRIRPEVSGEEMFRAGRIRLSTGAIHTVQPLETEIPKGRLTAVTGCIRIRKDDTDPGEPCPCPGGSHPGKEAAGACPLCRSGGHPPGEADRRHPTSSQ